MKTPSRQWSCREKKIVLLAALFFLNVLQEAPNFCLALGPAHCLGIPTSRRWQTFLSNGGSEEGNTEACSPYLRGGVSLVWMVKISEVNQIWLQYWSPSAFSRVWWLLVYGFRLNFHSDSFLWLVLWKHFESESRLVINYNSIVIFWIFKSAAYFWLFLFTFFPLWYLVFILLQQW